MSSRISVPLCKLHCLFLLHWCISLSFPRGIHKAGRQKDQGSHLSGKSHHPTEALDLMSCSATLRVFDKLSWTLHVVECQFVKYPKCGTCLAAPNWGRWDARNRLQLDIRMFTQSQTFPSCISVILREARHCMEWVGGREAVL